MANQSEMQILFAPARLETPETALKYVGKDGKKEVCFIWGESCCGQKKDGPQSAPPLVCSPDFLEALRLVGWSVLQTRVPQVFRVTPPPLQAQTRAYQPFSVAATCDAIFAACKAAHDECKFPVMVGGDHCLAMGSVAATAKRFNGEICVVWFDAHADINTIDTSPSGNIHGMPIAALIGLEGMRKIPGFEDNRFATVNPARVAWIGLRDVDPGEWDTIKALGIKTAFTMDDLKRHGMKRIYSMVMEAINPNGDLPVHLSFDVDGLDPVDAPSTGTAVADGVRIHDAVELVQLLRDSGNLAALDVVEVNPSLGEPDDVRATVTNAQLIIAQAIGSGR